MDERIWCVPKGRTTIRGIVGPLWYRIRNGEVQRHDGMEGDRWEISHTFGRDIAAFLCDPAMVVVSAVGVELDVDLLTDEGL